MPWRDRWSISPVCGLGTVKRARSVPASVSLALFDFSADYESLGGRHLWYKYNAAVHVETLEARLTSHA